MFEPFPKLTRFTHDWTVSEKIDGSNAAVLIVPQVEWPEDCRGGHAEPPEGTLRSIGNMAVLAQSRNRMLSVGKTTDHYGFAQFVYDNAEALVTTLGEGRHFGEWYGPGIGRRGYGLSEKRFALFNAGRWTGVELPPRVDVVPTLFKGFLSDSAQFDICMAELTATGSRIAPNFMQPEGIVMYHGPSQTSFKRTFEYDEAGKWAENQERKG